jgi:tRNA A37 N6-isopentenylltransferase MiaA
LDNKVDDKTVALIQQETRHYAKRQLTLATKIKRDISLYDQVALYQHCLTFDTLDLYLKD